MNTGFSALPNLGVTAGVGQTFLRTERFEYVLELQGTLQPWDDEDLHDDGNPPAGDLTQFQLGVKRAGPWGVRRTWTGRAGAVWFRAEGEPNIVQEPGDYLGVYVGAGFETRLTPHLSVGPDFVLMLVSLERSGEVDLVPQFRWTFTWAF